MAIAVSEVIRVNNQMKPHGPWKIKQTKDIYADNFIKVWRDEVVRPDGLDGQHVVVALKPGVCVLAIDEQWNIHLTEEFHYGVGRDSVEGVSGGIEPNEQPDETAIRELKEELGLEAETWEYITTTDPFTTVVTSPTRLYLAFGLTQVAANPEGTEQIQHRVISVQECYQLLLDGKITHSPTSILILIAYQRFQSSLG